MRASELERRLEPIARRIRLLLRRGTVVASDDSKGHRRLKVSGLGEEISDGVEHVEPYGFTSRPEAGASAILAQLLADPQKLIALVAGDKRYRPTDLALGETLVWSRFGQRVYLRADGVLRVESAGDVEIEAAGDVTATAVGTATVTAAKVVIEASGDVEVNAGGAAKITAGGVASIDASDIQMPDGAGDTVLLSTVIAKYNVHEHPAGFGNNPTGPPDTLLDASDATTVLKGG